MMLSTNGSSSGGFGGRGPGGGGNTTSGTSIAAGTLIRIEDDQGNPLLTYASLKDYPSLLFSSPDLVTGLSGTVLTGGTATGTEIDGLYTASDYSGGTEATTFTVQNTVNELSLQQ